MLRPTPSYAKTTKCGSLGRGGDLMRFRYLNGRSTQITDQELYQVLRSASFKKFLLVSVILSGLVNPINWIKDAPTYFWVIFWPVKTAAFLLIYFGVMRLMISIATSYTWKQITHWHVTGITLLVVIPFSETFGRILLSGFQYSMSEFITLVLVGAVTTEFFATLFVSHFFPHIYEDFIATSSLENDSDSKQKINIAGHCVSKPEINYVVSNNHRLVLHMGSKTLEMNAALSSFLEQTHKPDGIQLHRYVWIARHAITGVRKEGHQLWITAQDNRRWSVARPRIPQVLGWILEHRPDLVPQQEKTHEN
jgi:DNA-binding LytR/AlgR family response regulator